jgi:hypothetical protein
MRTTLTLDDDVARQIRKRAGGERGAFKRVLNDLLRRGLATGDKPAPAREAFVVQAKSCGFLPGVDHLKLNQLLDEAEIDEFIEKHKVRRKS